VDRSLAASAVAAAEQALPVLDPIPVVDASPRSHPPVLDVPTEWRNAEVRRAPIGLLASAALTLVGALPFAAGRRRRVVLSGAHA